MLDRKEEVKDKLFSSSFSSLDKDEEKKAREEGKERKKRISN